MTKRQTELLQGLRILVVDDDEISRLVACDVLGNLGAEVSSAPSPHDALQKVATFRYDLIILDLYMPDMNGMELAKSLVNFDSSLKKNIIILSATDPGHDFQFITDASSFRIFTKPLDVNELLSHVSQLNISENSLRNNIDNHIDIYGIDIEAGIRNFFGQKKSFFHTLLAFPEYGLKFISDYTRALQNREIEECHRLAHSLKGSSTMIGAATINSLARQLEKECGASKGIASIRPLFQSIEMEILKINASIQSSEELQTDSCPGKHERS